MVSTQHMVLVVAIIIVLKLLLLILNEELGNEGNFKYSSLNFILKNYC